MVSYGERPIRIMHPSRHPRIRVVLGWNCGWWHWSTTMSQMSFFSLFHKILLSFFTFVTLWLADITNH